MLCQGGHDCLSGSALVLEEVLTPHLHSFFCGNSPQGGHIGFSSAPHPPWRTQKWLPITRGKTRLHKRKNEVARLWQWASSRWTRKWSHDLMRLLPQCLALCATPLKILIVRSNWWFPFLLKGQETNPGKQTYSWPDMHNFCPHYSVHRILISKPVLSAAIHNATIGALNHIPAVQEKEELVTQVHPQVTRRGAINSSLILTPTRHTWQGPSKGNQWMQKFLAPP